MDKKKQSSIAILNDFVNILIADVSNKYLEKLKKDRKNPHKLIESYLDQAVFLSEQDVEIWAINNYISSMEEETKEEFNYWIEQDKEYKNLVKELNFVFNVIKYEEIQYKVLTSLYENFNKLNIERTSYENINYKSEMKDDKRIDFSSILKEVNKNKRMMSELNYLF